MIKIEKEHVEHEINLNILIFELYLHSLCKTHLIQNKSKLGYLRLINNEKA